MAILETFQKILLLKKSYRDQLSKIKDEASLKKFLKQNNISFTNEILEEYKNIIPNLYYLSNFINKIDSELNIKSIDLNNYGVKFKNFRNVKNFSETMKTFETSKIFISFGLDKAKVIGIHFNIPWIRPPLEMSIYKKINKSILNSFELLRQQLEFYRQEERKKLFKTDKDVSNQTLDYKINYNNFNWNFNEEQAIEIFEKIYGFKPNTAKNNGLYTLILEFNKKYFGTLPQPIHEINNIEIYLLSKGISKNEISNIQMKLKLIKLENNILYIKLLNNNKEIAYVKLLFSITNGFSILDANSITN